MSATSPRSEARSIVPLAVVAAALGVFALAVASGTATRTSAILLLVVTAGALWRPTYFGWPRSIAALILIILFIPIRRYSLPGNLPFHLELYRIFVALLLLGWIVALLVDPRTRLRRTGFEGPILVILGSMFASIVANPGRVSGLSSEVDKKLMFFLSFLFVLYLTSSAIRRLDNIEFLAKTLVMGGGVVAFFAIVEAKTGLNVFNHLSRVIPILHDDGNVGGFQRFGAARLRVFASAQHPIALSAALVMITPLSLYLARRYRQRRWYVCALLLVTACAATVSRTGVVMLVVVLIVFVWLRPQAMRRMVPALVPALIAVHLVLPGTLGALKQAFLPSGGLVAEQTAGTGSNGSGRLAHFGPEMREYRQQPLFGEGFATRIVDPGAIPGAALAAAPTAASGASTGTPGAGANASILDDQWLGTLLETGAIGAFGWIWFFIRVVRRFGAEAKRDESERGWLLASLAAGVTAYSVGMLTYDAFSFIQVTFLLFIFVGLGSALMAERPTPLAARTSREDAASAVARPAHDGSAE